MLGRRIAASTGLALIAGLVVVLFLFDRESRDGVGAARPENAKEHQPTPPALPDDPRPAGRRALPPPASTKRGSPAPESNTVQHETQASETGRLVGRFMSSTGSPIRGHVVRARPAKPVGNHYVAYTDETGWFEFPELAADRWVITTSDGNGSAVHGSVYPHGEVRVEAGRTSHMDLYLRGEGVLTGRFGFRLEEMQAPGASDPGARMLLELRTLGDPPVVIAEQDLYVTENPDLRGPEFPEPEEWTPEAVTRLLEEHRDSRDIQDLLQRGVTPEMVAEMREMYERSQEKAKVHRAEIGSFRFEGLEHGLYTLRVYLSSKEPTKITFHTAEGPQPVEVILYLERPVEIGDDPVAMPEEIFGFQEFLDASFARL